MKENSIEEDIKILKELGREYYKSGEVKIKALSGAKYIWALQDLLSDYKRVLKENEEFKAVDNECSRLEQKEVELEKTIDLMAEFFNKRSWREHQLKDDSCYCCKIEYGADDCKDCLKEYFIKKAKEVMNK